MLVVYYHMDKPVSSQFDQTVNKIDGKLVNFILESHLPFVQISSILAKKRPQKRETVIKDGSEEIEHKFPFGTF